MLVGMLLDKDPNKRPSVAEILQMDFVKNKMFEFGISQETQKVEESKEPPNTIVERGHQTPDNQIASEPQKALKIEPEASRREQEALVRDRQAAIDRLKDQIRQNNGVPSRRFTY